MCPSGATKSINNQAVNQIRTDNAMAKRKTNSDLVYVVCVCLRIMVSNTYCIVFFLVFFLRLVYIMLPVSLHYIFLIALSVFSHLYYLQKTVENLKIELHEPHRKLGVNSDAPEGQEVPIPPVILVISIDQ